MAVDPAIQFSAGLPLRAAQLNQQVRDYNVQGMLGLARTRGQMAYVTAEREIGMIDPPTDTTVLQHAGTSNTPPSWAKVQGVHIQNSTITKNKLASDVTFGPQAGSIRMEHLASGAGQSWRGLNGAELFWTYEPSTGALLQSDEAIPPYGWMFVHAFPALGSSSNNLTHLDKIASYIGIIPTPILASGARFGPYYLQGTGSYHQNYQIQFGNTTAYDTADFSGSSITAGRLAVRSGYTGNGVSNSRIVAKFYWYENAVGLGVPV